jgi:hypothetical protein
MRQLSLWETPSQRGERLQKALDAVRDRYGKKAIRRAVDLQTHKNKNRND